MGFWGNLVPFKRRQDAILRSPEEWLVDVILGGIKSSAGISVDPLKALGVTTVLACVNVISRAIATLPLIVYEKTPDGKVRAERHRLYNTLHLSPNEDMTIAEFLLAMQGNLTLRNNAYALIERNGAGRVRMHPIENGLVLIRLEDNKPVYYVDNQIVPNDEILHVRGLTPTGYLGYDTIATVKDAIVLAISLQDDVAQFFANGARMGTTLTTDQTLKAETVQKIRENLDKRHGGSGNQYKTAILTGGLKPFIERFNYSDSQMVEQRDFQQREIARIFNVALHKIQINDNIPRANNEEQNRQFVTDTLRPYIVAWEQRLNLMLLSARERERYCIEFVMEGLLRGNTKERYESYQIARQNGWLSINEIRERENLNKIGEIGDTYIEPMNMRLVGSSEQDYNPEA